MFYRFKKHYNQKPILAIKNEQKHSPELKQEQSGHLESRIHDYIKIIEGLREELTKEQQLRLLYEQRFTDLKTTLSASFGSLPNGMNLDHNESASFFHSIVYTDNNNYVK